MRHEMIEQGLGNGVEYRTDAASVATSTVSAVAVIAAQLHRLVGKLAASALCKRSMHLARSSFPRLAPADCKKGRGIRPDTQVSEENPQ